MKNSTQQTKNAQIKAYERIQSGYYKGKSIPKSVQRQANKGRELIKSGYSIPTKKSKKQPTQPIQPTQPTQPTQPSQPSQPIKPISVSTSKTQLQTIKTTNKKLKEYSINITLNFAKPINSNTFKSRYNYLLRRILSSFKNFTFTKKMQVYLRSETIFKDNKGKDAKMGNSTGYQICKNLSQLKNNLTLLFDLIGSTCVNSLQFISFIDLTINIFEFA